MSDRQLSGNRTKFGPSGNPDRFYELGHKSTQEIPLYLKELGLTAYEYQCGRGIHIKEESARRLGAAAAECGIAMSLHAPYYISLSSADPEKRDNSIDYLLNSAQTVDWLSGNRVILHSGSAGKLHREQALELAVDTLTRARRALDEAGFAHILLCPETMGKLNQLGSLEEVLALCAIDERIVPCVDFGHLNCRSQGQMNSPEQFAFALDAIEQALGDERARSFHVHFSKIEYTKGGEKKHLNFNDDPEGFGPEFGPLAKLIHERDLALTIVCESAGAQDLDALAMMQMLMELN